MKIKIEVKEIVVILLFAILCISVFFRDNYYISIVTILSGILISSKVNVYDPLHKSLKEQQKNWMLFISPLINIIIIIFIVIYILFFRNPICFLILLIAYIIDILFNLLVLKNKSISGYLLLALILLYLIRRITRM